MDGPRTHTQQPAVTGTSVLGIKYKDGVMLAADTLASYGRLSKYRDTTRLVGVGQHTVVGAGGDISDFQHIQHVLTSLTYAPLSVNIIFLSPVPKSMTLTMATRSAQRMSMATWLGCCMRDGASLIRYGTR